MNKLAMIAFPFLVAAGAGCSGAAPA